MVIFTIRSAVTITAEKVTGWVIGQSSEHFDFMITGAQAEYKIVDQKVLGPEIL